jgi:hypothetical protein
VPDKGAQAPRRADRRSRFDITPERSRTNAGYRGSTLRWPSPWNGLAASTALIAAGQRRRRDAETPRDGLKVIVSTTETPLRFCVAATSCYPGRATLRQTLAVAPRRSASLQCSAACPSDTSQAEFLRLRVPINRAPGNWQAGKPSLEGWCQLQQAAIRQRDRRLQSG